MCGLVGIAGRMTINEERAFKCLLELDTIRGPHSTGIGTVGHNGAAAYLKNVGTPWDMYSDSECVKLFAKYYKVLMGHNRWATKGKITPDNAHPFIHGDYMGAHNGTLTNQYDLKDHKKFEVDSENLYYHMSQTSVEETLKTIRGPFALVWYNIKDETINFVRNYERPLNYAVSVDGKTVFWASEGWMINVATQKNDIKIGEIKKVEEEKLYSIKINGAEIQEGLVVKIEPVVFYRFPVSTYSDGDSNFWRGHSHYHQGHIGNAKPKNGNVVQLVKKSGKPFLIDYNRKYMGEDIIFSVIGRRRVNKTDFVLCEIENDEWEHRPSVRVYVNKGVVLADRLENSVGYFKGKVKGIAEYGNEVYLTLSHHTIEECDLPPEEKVPGDDDGPWEVQQVPDKLKGPDGKMISFTEWRTATERGCAMCMHYPSIKDHDSIKWFGEDFFCNGCKDTPFAEEYLQEDLTRKLKEINK